MTTASLRLPAVSVIAWLVLSVAASGAETYKVVVNAANPVASLAPREISAFFLKRTSSWTDGSAVLPVDGPDSPARESFSKDVHGRKTAAVRSHWLQMIFSGRGVPPPEKAFDEGVIDYVKAHAGAIGYVSPTASTTGVKVLKVEP